MEREETGYNRNHSATEQSPAPSKISTESNQYNDQNEAHSSGAFNWPLSFLRKINPYKLKLTYYFIFLTSILLLVWCSMLALKLRLTSGKFEEYEKLRKDSLEAKFTITGYLYNLIYMQNSVFLTLGINLLVMITCYQTVLSQSEKHKVASYRLKLEEIAKPVPRAKFDDPNLPERAEFIKVYSALSRVIGEKNFRLNIMRVEFLKEALSLDWIAFLFFRLILSRFQNPQLDVSFRQVQLLSEFILAGFLSFKNVVYLDTRLSSQSPRTFWRRLAPIIYLIFFVVKCIHVVIISTYMNSLSLTLLSVTFAYGFYHLSDKINDSHQLNTIRTKLYTVFYHK